MSNGQSIARLCNKRRASSSRSKVDNIYQFSQRQKCNYHKRIDILLYNLAFQYINISKGNTKEGTVNKLINVCYALSNLSEPVVYGAIFK